MTYVNPDFLTKKALHEAINQGQSVTLYEPVIGTVPDNGTVYLEGPHGKVYLPADIAPNAIFLSDTMIANLKAMAAERVGP